MLNAKKNVKKIINRLYKIFKITKLYQSFFKAVSDANLCKNRSFET